MQYTCHQVLIHFTFCFLALCVIKKWMKKFQAQCGNCADENRCLYTTCIHDSVHVGMISGIILILIPTRYRQLWNLPPMLATILMLCKLNVSPQLDFRGLLVSPDTHNIQKTHCIDTSHIHTVNTVLLYPISYDTYTHDEYRVKIAAQTNPSP